MNPLLLSQDRRPKSRHHIIIGHLYLLSPTVCSLPHCIDNKIRSRKSRHAIFSSKYGYSLQQTTISIIISSAILIVAGAADNTPLGGKNYLRGNLYSCYELITPLEYNTSENMPHHDKGNQTRTRIH